MQIYKNCRFGNVTPHQIMDGHIMYTKQASSFLAKIKYTAKYCPVCLIGLSQITMQPGSVLKRNYKK